MSTPVKEKSIRLLATPSILNKTNPEIFTTPPRPGGTTKGDSSFADQPNESTALDDLHIDLDQTVSREFRLNAALEGSNWSMTSSEETSPPSMLAADPLRDSTEMLTAAISTIMFLASERQDDLTKQQINWTIKYLSCIQDEFGNLPPNVRGILNHLKFLYNNDLSQFEDEPMYVNESGHILDASLMAEKTEKCSVRISMFKNEEEDQSQKPTS